LEQRNRALRQFNYAVSHELKTPLVSIETSLGLIQSSLPQTTDPELTRTFGYARTAARQMNNLLESLLLMFRIDSADSGTETASFRVLVQNTIDQLTKEGKLEGINVSMAKDGPELCGDRDKLMQIWLHLIGNAAKYMGGQKSPAIDIGAEQIDQEIQFFVRDNGKGIEKSYQDKIFGLFDRLDKNADGTGLGLTLVKRIVEYYGGTIRVESAGAGQGSCFYFTLPDVLSDKGTRA
jgi:signal transduction histidine kinase